MSLSAGSASWKRIGTSDVIPPIHPDNAYGRVHGVSNLGAIQVMFLAKLGAAISGVASFGALMGWALSEVLREGLPKVTDGSSRKG